jgi:hypothetical protein
MARGLHIGWSNKGDLTALEVGFGVGGAFAVAILGYVLYHTCVRWAARRRVATARRRAMKAIRKVELTDFRRERAPEDVTAECAVCLEDYQDDDEMAVLECGHYLHYRCGSGWTANGGACPCCAIARL